MSARITAVVVLVVMVIVIRLYGCFVRLVELIRPTFASFMAGISYANGESEMVLRYSEIMVIVEKKVDHIVMH